MIKHSNFSQAVIKQSSTVTSTRYRRRVFEQSFSGHASTQLRSWVTSAQSNEGWTGARQHETAETRACSDALIGLAHGRESEASIRHPLQPRPAWHRLRPCGSSLRAQEDLTAIWDVEYSLHFASTSPPFRLEFIALHQGVKLQRPQVTSWQHLGLRFGARLHRRRENDEQRSWQENEHDRS